jgi:type IV secretory pathway VirB4 component
VVARARRAVHDRVAPSLVRLTPLSYRLERELVRGLLVSELPSEVEPGWLAALLAAEFPLDVSLHVEPIDAAPLIADLTVAMRRMQGAEASELATGDRVGDEARGRAFRSCRRLRQELVNRRQQAFAVGLYLLVHAASEAELDDATAALLAKLRGLMATGRVAAVRQDRAFQTCLPLGLDRLREPHILPTDGLATLFPFIDPTLTMPRGVLLGLAGPGRAAVILDLFDHRAFPKANGAIVASTGAGKSVTAKVWSARLRYAGVRTIVIDPANEYRRVCAELGGQQIDLHPGTPHRLNPLELPPAHADDDDAPLDRLAAHIDTLTGLLTLMIEGPGGRLSEARKALLEAALDRAYAAAGVARGHEATYDRPPPLLRDVVAELAALGRPEAAGMATALARYTTGVQRGLFDGPTNLDLTAQYVVFNTRHVDEELKPLMLQAVATFVWARLRPEEPTMVLFDEAWELVQHPKGGAFVERLARTIRKHGGGLVTLTQQVTDFLASPRGRAVLANSEWRLILRQDEDTVREVQRLYGLSEEEVTYLTRCPAGHGLLLALGNRVAVEIATSPREYAFATTAPRDLAAMRAPPPEDPPAAVAPRRAAEPAWPAPIRPAAATAAAARWRWAGGLLVDPADAAETPPDEDDDAADDAGGRP